MKCKFTTHTKMTRNLEHKHNESAPRKKMTPTTNPIRAMIVERYTKTCYVKLFKYICHGNHVMKLVLCKTHLRYPWWNQLFFSTHPKAHPLLFAWGFSQQRHYCTSRECQEFQSPKSRAGSFYKLLRQPSIAFFCRDELTDLTHAYDRIKNYKNDSHYCRAGHLYELKKTNNKNNNNMFKVHATTGSMVQPKMTFFIFPISSVRISWWAVIEFGKTCN